MALNRVKKKIVKALNSIWKILIKNRRKIKRLLVLLKVLRDYIKDRKNKIQEFLIY